MLGVDKATSPSAAHVLSARHAKTLERLERFAWLMDQSITIPGTKIRLGLDGLIGLLPIGGDVATGLAQAGFVLMAQSGFQLPKPIVRRMAANVLIDVLVGAIPLLGDVFDVHFKASTRNLDLLRKHLANAEDERTARVPGGWRLGR